MSLSESLTVEITADSSGLEAELQRAASLVEGLSSQLGGVGSAASAAAGSLGRLGEAVGPLSRLSNLLGQIVGQIRAIGQTPVTIDVSPAMGSLETLSKRIAAVAAQLAALNARASMPRPAVPSLPGVGFGGAGGGGSTGGGCGGVSPRMSLPGFAAGGLVNGPAGVDRVPAMLTAGEFVLTTDAVRDVGRPALEALNRGLPFVRPEPGETTRPGGATTETVTADPSVTVNVAAAGERVETRERTVERTLERETATREVERTTAAAASPVVVPPNPPPQAGPVFNEITVQVTQAVDLDELLRDLQLGQTTALDRFA